MSRHYLSQHFGHYRYPTSAKLLHELGARIVSISCTPVGAFVYTLDPCLSDSTTKISAVSHIFTNLVNEGDDMYFP
jgi:hypothetical protein